MSKRLFPKEEEELIILVFDTETEGLGHHHHIIEIAWKLLDNNNVLESYATLIRPENNWAITKPDWESSRAFEVNGIRLQTCLEQGVSHQEMMLKFIDAATRADLIMAHNIRFDMGMILKFCNDEQRALLQSKSYACTMEMAKRALPFITNGNHKLQNVHTFLFQEPIQNQHRAMGDVEATCRCLRILRGITQFNLVQLGSQREKTQQPPATQIQSQSQLPPATFSPDLIIKMRGKIIHNRAADYIQWMLPHMPGGSCINSIEIDTTSFESKYDHTVFVKTSENSLYQYGFGWSPEDTQATCFKKSVVKHIPSQEEMTSILYIIMNESNNAQPCSETA